MDCSKPGPEANSLELQQIRNYLAKHRSGDVKDHCTMAKTYKTETSSREIILVSLDQGFTEKPESGLALGFEPPLTSRAEFRLWAKE